MYLVAMKITIVDGFIVLAIARLIHGLSGAAILTAGFAQQAIFGRQFWRNIWQVNRNGNNWWTARSSNRWCCIHLRSRIRFHWISNHNCSDYSSGLCHNKGVRTWWRTGSRSSTAQGFHSEPCFIQNGLLVTMTTLATGALEAGIPLFLEDNLGLNAAWIGAVLLVMVVAQELVDGCGAH